MIKIRPAVFDDAEEAARLNFDTWTTSFNDIVPADWMAQRDLAEHIDKFKEYFASPGFGGMFIAEIDGKMAGFADGGANRDKESPYDAQLYAIYVRKEHQRKGIGKQLLGAVVGKIVADGFHSIAVKTFADSPYRRFYEKLGAQVVTPFDQKWESRGKTKPLIAYFWQDLDRLRQSIGVEKAGS